MTGNAEELIHGYLDGTLTPEDEAALNAWVSASPTNANTFAGIALLHDRLHDVVALHGKDEMVPKASASRSELAIPKRRSFRWRLATAVGSLAVVAAVVIVWMSIPTPLTAAGELDRLIDSPAPSGDRTYRIINLDPQAEVGDGRQPPIEGAVLHIRNPDKYVLIRQFPDGRKFVTGSDGERSWSIRPEGAVRVSGDPLRFRGPLPGNQHGIPFLDLRTDLLQLRDAYIVSIPEQRRDGLRGLLFEKKSPEYRGPKRVELWYDPQTSMIHRMEFNGMPQARGGPNHVAVELLEQRDLGPVFFRHETHHTPDRRVIEED